MIEVYIKVDREEIPQYADEYSVLDLNDVIPEDFDIWCTKKFHSFTEMEAYFLKDACREIYYDTKSRFFEYDNGHDYVTNNSVKFLVCRIDKCTVEDTTFLPTFVESILEMTSIKFELERDNYFRELEIKKKSALKQKKSGKDVEKRRQLYLKLHEEFGQ